MLPLFRVRETAGVETQRNADGIWIPQPAHRLTCPPGLEYLSVVDHVIIQQKVELVEAFTGFETANKYSVKNSLGQLVYVAVEESNCWNRNCCGANRPFGMKILDNRWTEVMYLYRPLKCDCC
ncbi:unnamed protein product [Darwinula stevensoni]|uniref:Phospholipid scramblase n=1 Tax=Darwinula stevensoni TaxID=69355 RepID=A0A7R9FQ46_9CRUS|nr:unnamed protein product [Darwinula stevensoni]CAG0898781.1 unnamed protein product [Darwinula stevensoni]